VGKIEMNPTPEEYADITEVAGLDDTLKVLVATMKRLPNTICLVRRGDFYEAFSEGAKILSRELDFVLTSTKIGKVRVLMSGFPHHTLDQAGRNK
jgi:DNA mismatch repair ATPase MutS